MTLPVDGVLVVDKPAGPTSHDVVAVARRALGTSKVGHTGTLDPMATGVLVLVVGRATRLARYMASDVKSYEAQVSFGRSTDTYDAMGAVTSESGRFPAPADLLAELEAFAGTVQQTPPAYSAKKIGGEAAYKLARRDRAVLPAPVEVTVHRLDLVSYDQGTATLSLTVSSGFYVRSLAHDLGTRLGTGAHLSALRRTRAGAFGLDEALTWETLAGRTSKAHEALLSIDRLLPELPAVSLNTLDAAKVRHGQSVHVQGPVLPPGAPVRILDTGGHLLGIAELAYSPAATSAVVRPVVILG